ncbi:MAG: hypothetical protein RIF41_00250, partial [Polyangiaceae bacterium]
QTADGGPSPSATGVLVEAAEDEAAEAAEQQRGEAKAADERVEIPAGKLVAGSVPGDQGRDPSTEPAQLEVDLGAFTIDKLPYPNDPEKPPLRGVSREDAAKRCAERDGRLCTELEWERACKGPNGTRYAGGTRWDAACGTTPETCASGVGVRGRGAAPREWTASDVAPIKNLIKGGAAVRGAAKSAADVDHRCAHRSVVAPESTADDLGFRCCYGDASEATIPSPDWEETIKRIDLPTDELSKLFASNDRLSRLAKDIVYFNESAAADTVMRRGRARGTDAGGVPDNTYLTTSPVVWNPVPGEQILLVAGRSGDKTSFVVAFHQLPGGRHRVGAALIMEDEVGPVVLVYNPFVRRKLHWTTCWECYGATGNITYRDENRVVITQK